MYAHVNIVCTACVSVYGVLVCVPTDCYLLWVDLSNVKQHLIVTLGPIELWTVRLLQLKWRVFLEFSGDVIVTKFRLTSL